MSKLKQAEDVNPFNLKVYTGPENFCDREKETQKIFDALKTGKHYTIFSLRRMGKSGLIHHAMHKLRKEKVNCIYFDIMKTDSFAGFAQEFIGAFLSQGISRSTKFFLSAAQIFKGVLPIIKVNPLTGEMMIEVSINRTDFLYSDIEAVFNYIKNSGSKYLIAIDEFQQILNYPEKNVDAFLRSHIQFMENASFIFSGSKKNMLLTIFGSYSKPLWQTSGFLELQPIDAKVYRSFIKKKFQITNTDINDKAIDYIFEITNGITYYIQLICNALWERKLKVITLEEAEKTSYQVIEEIQSYYVSLLNFLTPNQKEILTAIARENGIEQLGSKKFIKDNNISSPNSIYKTSDFLLDKELIYRADDKKYYLTDPLFAMWLKKP